MSRDTIAFLAQGRIFLADGPGAPREVKSPFAEQVLERHRRIEQRHAWKSEGRGARFMRGGMAWELPEHETAVPVPIFTCVSAAPNADRLLYGVEVAGVKGICQVRRDLGDEQRLVHGSERIPEDLAAQPGQAYIACTLPRKDGSTHIGVMDREGGGLRQLTDGDTRDMAPAWVPGEPSRLLFHSAGIARDGNGFQAALGPCQIQRLEIRSGELETLLEDPEYDFMAPRMDADGSLYCLRKPYRSRPTAAGFGRFLLDAALVPFRLLRALFHALNFFSAKYTGKPLTTAGNARREGADLKRIWLYGNLVDAEAAVKASAARGEEAPSLVPRDWQLVRQRPAQGVEVLASGVAGFALGDDGRIVFTNGSALFTRAEDGSTRRLLVHPGIQKVVLV